jgi:hypothetical protein
MEEGEVKNFEGVLWTTADVGIGSDGEPHESTVYVEIPIHSDGLYKVFRSRNKFYGSFFRLLLIRIRP